MKPNEDDDDDGTQNNSKLDMLTDELMKVKVQKREIDEIANGKKPEIYHEFIKDIFSKTVK